MALDNTITIAGNLTREPELRFTPSGQPVANFSVAVNRRWANRTTGEYEEAVTFVDVTAWGDLGEHCAESLPKGARVVVVGRLDQQTWQNDQGDNRHKHLVTADDVAPSLKWANAKVMRLTRDHANEPSPARVPARHNPDEEPF